MKGLVILLYGVLFDKQITVLITPNYYCEAET